MGDSAMLWTGGKDSALALHESIGAGHRVRCLVTFAPPAADFLAHPSPILALQAEALKIPHHIVQIHAPYEQSYEAALAGLREKQGVDTLITGDIDLVNGQPNWIRERARPLGLAVHTPLWGRDRKGIIEELLALKFRIVFSCVDTRVMAAGWVGRELDAAALAELLALEQSIKLDPCGENGEYHTITVGSPDFGWAVELPAFSVGSRAPLAHMRFET